MVHLLKTTCNLTSFPQEEAATLDSNSVQPAESEAYEMVELSAWYFGSIDSIHASNKCKQNGDFLVRYSVHKRQYILSCRWKDKCQHFIMAVNTLFKHNTS